MKALARLFVWGVLALAVQHLPADVLAEALRELARDLGASPSGRSRASSAPFSFVQKAARA